MTKTLKLYLLKFKFLLLQCVQTKATIPEMRKSCAICSPKSLFLSCYKIGLIPKKMYFDYWKDIRNSDVSFWQSCNLMKLVLYHIIPFTMHGDSFLPFPLLCMELDVWKVGFLNISLVLSLGMFGGLISTFKCSLRIKDLWFESSFRH